MIQYGKRHPVVLRWIPVKKLIRALTFLTLTMVAQGKATSPGSGPEKLGLVGIQLQSIGRHPVADIFSEASLEL